MEYRIEKDTLGEIKVEKDRYWGAQTQRSLENFKIGKQKMPHEIIKSITIVKISAAIANYDLGILKKDKCELIIEVCNEILEGKLSRHFPLVVWQTGSGTQTNMNVNEVISNRAEEILFGNYGDKPNYISPNDDVNQSQSSNDVFPTAMNIASYIMLKEQTLPALQSFKTIIDEKVKEFSGIIKTGRTHLMDATPITLGQEFSAYSSQIEHCLKAINFSLNHLSELPIGGTATGTGLNSPQHFDLRMVENISKLTNFNFKVSDNKFEALSAHDAIVGASSSLKQTAICLMKIANDIRLLASGPRCGIAEIFIPENEPGSSIMPGKVNPTQCEALTMVCAQVIGNDAAITIGGMQGQLQLNVFMPLMITNLLNSANLIADAVKSFEKNCFAGIKPNLNNINKNLENNLMLVTALNPHIGYYNAAKIAQLAFNENLTLKQAAIKSELVSEKDFELWMNPKNMI